MVKIKNFIIICGPTATGKTELGLKLAKKFKGEIVSADSRQVYKGMDVGTGKDIDKTKVKWQKSKVQVENKKFQVGFYLIERIPIWGLDLVNPDYQFNAGEYKEVAEKIIDDILARNKLPIVVGGTGLYIKSLVEPMALMKVPQDSMLREELKNLGIKELKNKLKKINKKKYQAMNNSDLNNPRRLIRAIEITNYLSTYSNLHDDMVEYKSKKKFLLIGLTAPKEILFQRVKERVKKRLKQGIVKEILSLLKKGYSWNLPAMSGLGYKEFRTYFEEKASLEQVIEQWQRNEINYLKRQLVWFKKMTGIRWFDITKPDFYTEVENFVCPFLTKAFSR